jgi:hypothetical protein
VRRVGRASSLGKVPGIGFERTDEGDDMAKRSEADWNELTAEGRRILQRVAPDAGLIDYGDFNRELPESTRTVSRAALGMSGTTLVARIGIDPVRTILPGPNICGPLVGQARQVAFTPERG